MASRQRSPSRQLVQPINAHLPILVAIEGSELVPIGSVFTRLTVIGREFCLHEKRGPKMPSVRFVVAECECGRVTAVRSSALLHGRTRSCGCLVRDISGRINLRHGDARQNAPRHRLHIVWSSMKQRCYSPSCKAYKWYGLRGISIFDDWRNDFVAFRDYCLANGWQHGLTIDRINNDGNYEPENIRFVGRGVQSNNTRSNRLIAAFGEIKNLRQWSIDPRCVVTVHALRERLNRGVQPEDAITTPSRFDVIRALGITTTDAGVK